MPTDLRRGILCSAQRSELSASSRLSDGKLNRLSESELRSGAIMLSDVDGQLIFVAVAL